MKAKQVQNESLQNGITLLRHKLRDTDSDTSTHTRHNTKITNRLIIEIIST